MSQTPPSSPLPAPAPAPPSQTKTEGLLAWAVRQLRHKTWGYWIVAFIVLVVAKEASPSVYDYLGLTNARSQFFQALLDWSPRPAEPRVIKIVRIENDEYWEGILAGRRPTKRDYLADLVGKLVSLNAHVIALDFDVRLPRPESLEIPEDYRAETRTFIEAIKDAARHGKKVVLATPVWLVGDDLYRQDTDIYQANGLCLSREKVLDSFIGPQDPVTTNVACGFISLPDDPLRIPPPIAMADGGRMDPFSLVVAKAVNPELIAGLLQKKKELGYLDFISHDKFQKANAIFSARAIRLGTISPEALDSKVVIVGAGWSRDASGRGLSVDLWPTPVGDMVGVELHANFAEAFLDSRVFDAVSQHMLDGSEILFGIFAAIVFAIIPRAVGKAIGLLVLLLAMFAISALALRLFSVFFDAFVPLVGLGIHTLYESFAGRHSEAAETAHS